MPSRVGAMGVGLGRVNLRVRLDHKRLPERGEAIGLGRAGARLGLLGAKLGL